MFLMEYLVRCAGAPLGRGASLAVLCRDRGGSEKPFARVGQTCCYVKGAVDGWAASS